MKKNNIKPSEKKLIEQSIEIVSTFKEVKKITLIWMYRYLELLLKECRAEIERRDNREVKSDAKS